MHKPIPWTVEDIVAATGGTCLTGNSSSFFEGVSIDSRKISPDDLFVAIKGQNHDGHQFIAEVKAKGCRGFLVHHADACAQTGAGVCVKVENTTRALGQMGTYQRRRSNVSVAAITGSNGKTTTRELIYLIFNLAFPTLTTSGNFNNEIGLPLTLLRLGYEHQWAVVELGMNHPGEIRSLARICQPDIGVVTNIAPAHLEGVGDIDGVAKAKGELITELNPNGMAILNADDPRVASMANHAPCRVVLYGMSERAEVRGSDARADGYDQIFTLRIAAKTASVRLRSPGVYMITNALAAAAAAAGAGIDIDTIQKGIESFRPVHGRMEIYKNPKGVNIIDDTYNANPGSMRQAIQTLAALQKAGKPAGRSFAAIGDMFELGDQSAILHKEIGRLVARVGIDRLYVTGSHVQDIIQGAKEGNMANGAIFVGTREEITADLRKKLAPNDWLLAKGSRAMGMEIVIQGLKENDL